MGPSSSLVVIEVCKCTNNLTLSCIMRTRQSNWEIEFQARLASGQWQDGAVISVVALLQEGRRFDPRTFQCRVSGLLPQGGKLRSQNCDWACEWLSDSLHPAMNWLSVQGITSLSPCPSSPATTDLKLMHAWMLSHSAYTMHYLYNNKPFSIEA